MNVKLSEIYIVGDWNKISYVNVTIFFVLT